MEKLLEIWQPPFERTYTVVQSSNKVMTITFAFHNLSEIEMELVTDSINGIGTWVLKHCTREGGNFYRFSKLAFFVRGWENLTGINGLALEDDEAARIYEKFCKFIEHQVTNESKYDIGR